MLQISHTIRLKGLLARDYSEERTILSYFLNEELPNYKVLFTYNGKSYDLPRMRRRSKENAVLPNGENPLDPFMENGDHHDLLHLIRRKVKLPKRSSNLQTFEKVVYNFRRKGDIPGKKIPETYQRYVDGEANGKEIAQIVHHNFLDDISLAGALTSLCT
jgi:uncharacterized protein YprB with RNaseH-like and TPR domain